MVRQHPGTVCDQRYERDLLEMRMRDENEKTERVERASVVVGDSRVDQLVAAELAHQV